MDRTADADALYHAVEPGQGDRLAALLARGVDPRGTNALLRAIDYSDAGAVRQLLDAGAVPDECDAIPALHHAARRQATDAVCTLLLEAGADQRAQWQGISAHAFACVHGHAGLTRILEAVAEPLTPQETVLTQAAQGHLSQGQYIDPAKLPPACRTMLHDLVHLPGKLAHMRALVALGLEYDRADPQGVTPVQIAGFQGLPEIMRWFLSLRPDLSHRNSHGGTLLGAILHGADHLPERHTRDHRGCAQIALEQGVALPRAVLERVDDPALRAFLMGWAARYPGQVVDA